MLNEKSWRVIVKDAELYLKLGQIEHYLSGENDTDYPWSLATNCEPGGSHRLNISTGIWFSGEHESGLKFRWNFEIEPHSANGSGSYQIDTAAIRRVLNLLNGKTRESFRLYLNQCSLAVQKSATEYQRIADKEQGVASILLELSRQS